MWGVLAKVKSPSLIAIATSDKLVLHAFFLYFVKTSVLINCCFDHTKVVECGMNLPSR